MPPLQYHQQQDEVGVLPFTTVGMIATQPTKGVPGVAKHLGIDKELSLCSLWPRPERLSRMLPIEPARHVFIAVSSEISADVQHAVFHSVQRTSSDAHFCARLSMFSSALFCVLC